MLLSVHLQLVAHDITVPSQFGVNSPFQPGAEACHLLAGSACKALKAVLESSSAEVTACSDARLPQQAALRALLQQSVMVLGMAPEDLFEGLVERLEASISAKYEQKLQAATKEAVLAQVSLVDHKCLQLNMLHM